MEKLWTDDAWSEYLYWQEHDKKTLKRINALIKDIERNGPAQGIGKPERLKYQSSWSRRIDDTNRLTYRTDSNGFLHILSCKGHYED